MAEQLTKLPCARIKPSATNPRKHFPEAPLKELAASIKENGLAQPVVVRPHPKAKEMFELVVGERRWRAHQLPEAGPLAEITVIIRDLDDQAARKLQQIENLQRADISALEEADGFAAMIKDHGYTVEKLAKELGKSHTHVFTRLKLLTLKARPAKPSRTVASNTPSAPCSPAFPPRKTRPRPRIG